MRILFVSGGSVGHLAPLVAVERALKELHPDAETHFLCSDRREDQEFLKKEGVAFDTVPLPRRNLSMPWRLLSNFRKSYAIMREFKPDKVFSKGGAVSIPACITAACSDIPVILHESDAVMGRANGLVARFADVVCTGFPQTKGILTGNPIRPELVSGSREKGLKLTGLSGKRPVLLVFGGSQGAEALNEAVIRHIDDLLSLCDVVHLAGKGKRGADKRAGYWSKEFAYEEMADLYAVASFALSRAGAGTLSELQANGIPAILVPIEGLAHDHQVKNAEAAAASGKNILLRQKNLDGDIVKIVASWSSNPVQHEKTPVVAGSGAHLEAARRIAEILAKGIAQSHGSY